MMQLTTPYFQFLRKKKFFLNGSHTFTASSSTATTHISNQIISILLPSDTYATAKISHLKSNNFHIFAF